MIQVVMAAAWLAYLAHPMYAHTARVRDWPFAGCLVLPASNTGAPAPLLVLLRRDFESPERVLAKWNGLVAGRASILALGADHAAEWEALDRRSARLWEWLATKRRPSP